MSTDFIDLTDQVREELANRRQAERLREILAVLVTMIIASIIWLAGVGAGWLLLPKSDFTGTEKPRVFAPAGIPTTALPAHMINAPHPSVPVKLF